MSASTKRSGKYVDTHIWIPVLLHQHVHHEAERLGTTFSKYIRAALESYAKETKHD